MSEEMDKQEQATPFKLDEARKKGQVGKSQELLSLTVLFTLIGGLLALMPILADIVARSFSIWIENAVGLARDWPTLNHQIHNDNAQFLRYLGPLYLLSISMVVVVSVVHAGVVFSSDPLKPDFQRINPGKNLKKLFSFKALIELFKTVIKLFLFLIVSYFFFKGDMSQIFQAQWNTPKQIAAQWLRSTTTLMCWLLLILLLSAIFDLWNSKREFAKQMRMSRRDIKDEHRRREGDQEIKAKRKRTQLQLIKRVAGMKKVKDADVIITNPTHVAVALQYRPKTMAVPVVLTSGKGFFAKLILLIARKNRVPIMRRPALARSILKETNPGSPISRKHQNSVAQIYRWVVSMPGNKVLQS